MGWKLALDGYAAGMNVDAVAVSLCGMPIYGSSPASSAVEDWQFVCDEGPSIEAFRRNIPIDVPYTAHTVTRWAWLTDALGDWPFGAALALPIAIGPDPLGVVTLYRAVPGPFPAVGHGGGRAQLHAAVESLIAEFQGSASSLDLERFDLINQAVGVTAAQTGLTVAESMTVIRARAYSSHRSLDDVVRDITTLHLTFSALANE